MILNANPKLENYLLSSEINTKIKKIIKNGKYILSDNVNNFEKKFAKYIGVKYAVGVNSGTDALIIALRCFGIKKDDEVIIPGLSASATAIAVKNVGARIVYADINLNNYNICEKDILRKITKKTKAVIIVHLHGLTANMHKILKILKKKNIKIIEDCAQSHGSKLGNKKSGSFGDFGCFSFYPTKNLNCIGDGGIITTNDHNNYLMAKKIRQYGWLTRDNSEIIGINSRLDEIQAAILLIKLRRLDKLNAVRRKIAHKYLKNISNKNIILPKIDDLSNHVFHHFVVRLLNINRDKLIKEFLNRNIQILVHYKIPLFKQKALYGKKLNLKNTVHVCDNTISLPMYPGLLDPQINKICNILNKYE